MTKTIVKRLDASCGCCGQGGAIDQVNTGKAAEKWRRAANLVQSAVAEGMGISQAYYSALALGQRAWTPDLVAKFEAFVGVVITNKGVWNEV